MVNFDDIQKYHTHTIFASHGLPYTTLTNLIEIFLGIGLLSQSNKPILETYIGVKIRTLKCMNYKRTCASEQAHQILCYCLLVSSYLR